MYTKTSTILSLLISTTFIAQSCDNTSNAARANAYDTIENHQSDQATPLKDSVGIPIPTDEVVDEFYQAIFDNDEIKVRQMLQTKFPADYAPKNKIPPLQALIWSSDNVALAKIFVEANATIHDQKKLPILIAAEYGRLHILNYLIAQGADIKHSEVFNTAGFYQHYDCAKALLLHGANQEKGDVIGKLWMYENAVRKGDYEVLRALKLKTEEWNYNNCEGETPLIIAVKQNNMEMVRYLINRGANKTYPENFDCGDDIYQGKTPLEIAEEHNFRDIANFLKE